MDDRRKRQTSTATPAEPGDLPWVLEISIEGIANVLLRDVEEVRQKVASLKAHLAAGPTR
jgi:hypothetical protein